MDNWERFDEALLLDKKAFHNELYIEDITDKDYVHTQKVFEEIKLKNQAIIITCIFEVIRYCLQVYLKTLETSLFKHMNLSLLIFCLHQD